MSKNINYIFIRKANRLKEYDYSQSGMYFITVCVKDMKYIFGEIGGGEMKLNEFGEIVNSYWLEIPKHYSNVGIDQYIIMPNHIHGIIIIKEKNNVVEEQCSATMVKVKRGLLSRVIKSFKNEVTNFYKSNFNLNDSIWQRSFYDRIIRGEDELNKIRQYIIDNPAQWDNDKNGNENLFY